jgi:hypothetical protein
MADEKENCIEDILKDIESDVRFLSFPIEHNVEKHPLNGVENIINKILGDFDSLRNAGIEENTIHSGTYHKILKDFVVPYNNYYVTKHGETDYACPDCSAKVGEKDNGCPVCGVEFTESEEDEPKIDTTKLIDGGGKPLDREKSRQKAMQSLKEHQQREEGYKQKISQLEAELAKERSPPEVVGTTPKDALKQRRLVDIDGNPPADKKLVPGMAYTPMCELDHRGESTIFENMDNAGYWRFTLVNNTTGVEREVEISITWDIDKGVGPSITGQDYIVPKKDEKVIPGDIVWYNKRKTN